MIDPIQRFEDEHQHALGELAKLEVAARALAETTREEGAGVSGTAGGELGAGEPAGAEVHFAAARSAYDFLTSAVREHNENEEIALFSLLGEEIPTEPFVEDHIALRSMERRLLDAIEAREVGKVAAAGLAIVDVLRDHIDREDNLLFPMARATLGPEGLLEVARRLES